MARFSAVIVLFAILACAFAAEPKKEGSDLQSASSFYGGFGYPYYGGYGGYGLGYGLGYGGYGGYGLGYRGFYGGYPGYYGGYGFYG